MASSSSSNDTDELLKLLLLGFYLSKPSERAWAKGYIGPPDYEGDDEDKLADEFLKDLAALSKAISWPKDARKVYELSKEELMEKCLLYANLFLQKSTEIMPASKYSYYDLCNYLTKITQSQYYIEQPLFDFDFTTAKIGCFWDFEKLRKPTNIAKIRERFEKKLRTAEFGGYFGELEIFAIGRKYWFEPHESKELARQHITLHHTTNAPGHNDTGDRRMIAKILAWAFNHLRENNEPAIIVVITSDIDFLSAIQAVTKRKFRVVLVHNLKVSRELRGAASGNVHKTVRWEKLADLPMEK